MHFLSLNILISWFYRAFKSYFLFTQMSITCLLVYYNRHLLCLPGNFRCCNSNMTIVITSVVVANIVQRLEFLKIFPILFIDH